MNTASISVTTLIATIEKPLNAYYQDDILAQQYAWWLVSAVTGRSKAALVAMNRLLISAHEYQVLQEWILDLTVLHKPIAYVLGTVPFADLTLHVEPPTLIPRPETEEWVLSLIEQLQPIADRPLTILDIGTGTGCIALALAYALPEAHVIGIDISEQALELAQQNAQKHAIDNVTFLHSDLFENIADTAYFDLIVSNPPYISQTEWQLLDESVKQWEDGIALVSDENGLGVIQKIIQYAPHFLRPSQELVMLNIPNLAIEIGYTQGQEVSDYMKEHGFASVAIEKDSAGKDRVVKGQFNGLVWHE